jgi:hypothetical protein
LLKKKRTVNHRSAILKLDELVKSRHSREGGNPGARNFLKRMDSRLRTSGMTAMKRTFCDVVKLATIKNNQLQLMRSFKIMKIYIKDIREEDCICDALILPFTEGDSGLHDHLHPSLSKAVKKAFSGEFSGKQNEVLLVPAPEDMKPERICLAGLGRKECISPEKVRQTGGKALAGLRDRGMKKVALSSGFFLTHNISLVNFVEGALLGLYTFRKYKKENNI